MNSLRPENADTFHIVRIWGAAVLRPHNAQALQRTAAAFVFDEKAGVFDYN